jgi:hypothetical protein
MNLPYLSNTEDETASSASATPSVVVLRVQERLSNCPYSHYLNQVQFHYANATLTLSGCVPTYYLKQVLQTLLRDLEHIDRIVNNVDVVSSTGLSSAPRNDPR